MAKELYLHLGLHKTSSSSFQATCKANLSFLSDQGIAYPLFKCEQTSREDIANHSIPLFSLFSGKADKYHINIRRGIGNLAQANAAYMAQLNEILASNDKVILSGEDIGVMNSGGLKRLKEAIDKHNFNIKPFALVRDPYNFLNSAYQQMIKSGNYNPLISLGILAKSNVNGDLIIPNRIKAIETILNAFGDSVKLYPFAKACEHNDGPVRFILDEICRVQDTSSMTICRKNESRSNLWTRIQNQMNRVAPALKDGKPNAEHRKLRKNLFLDRSRKFYLTELEFSSIRESYQKLEEKMHKLLGDDFVGDYYTFSDPISSDVLTNLIVDYATLRSKF